MNISWKWLNELIDLHQTTPEEIVSKLTLAGFEIENIIKKELNDDIVFDIKITANRQDTASVIGITREISTLLKKPIRRINNQKHYYIQHHIIDKQFIHCQSFLYSHFDNIQVQSSPRWLKSKLESYKITSINNVIDIISLIKLKWGQYLEVFDLSKISNNNAISIKTEYSKENQIFVTRNDKIVTLNKQNTHNSIIITNNNYPIALAGIDSSKSSNIDLNTSSLLLQASIFNKNTIRSISKELGLETENSLKQAKGISSFDILNAYSEAILLIEYLCKGTIQSVHYFTQPRIQYKPFIIREQYINKILGFVSAETNTSKAKTITKTNIIQTLHYLNCIVFEHFEYFEIYIPPYKSTNIKREIDIIEEIGRTYGFDKFTDYIPNYNKKGQIKKEKFKIDQIRNILRTIGLTESLHSSLVKSDKNYLKICNPLNEDYTHLRHNIINNLIYANLNNLNQGNEAIEIFEIGKVFAKSSSNYIENIHIGGLIGSKEYYRTIWSEKPQGLTWFQAKGDIDEIFEKLQIDIQWDKPHINHNLYKNNKLYFHPNRVASLYSKEKLIGIFGQLDLKISQAFNIPKYTYIFEFKLKNLLQLINKKVIYQFTNYSKYPYVVRDITISFISRIQVKNLLEYINNNINPFIESIVLFDYYKTQKEGKEVINLGLRVKYRSHTDTLTNHMTDTMNEELQQKIKQYLKTTCEL
uniref:phenylalanine--tRNA ligase n=1 Tax=Kumanoa americana TaxID=1196377 RepID=A0A1C9CGQ6_9FLOR|nr:phenylalanyl-tRNA synthetase beta chain [Kumanoa americana]AOM67578.1 phenylalanyl-tRNA synthetase beta chain [Kumanoa americana]